MKKHLSVMMLYVRSILYKFILLVLVMAVVQSMFFAIAFRNAEGLYGLDTIMNNSRLKSVSVISFVILWILLIYIASDDRGKLEYTLSRLRISRKMVFIWQSIVNGTFLLLFRAVQVSLALTFCVIYTKHFPQQQAPMLVFYTNKLLHNLLPLKNILLLVTQIFITLALAVTFAAHSVRINKKDKTSMSSGVLGFFTYHYICGFDTSEIYILFFLLFAALFILIHGINSAFEEAEDE